MTPRLSLCRTAGACALLTAACGRNAQPKESMDGAVYGGDAAAYAGCPTSLPVFASGLAVRGESGKVRVKLLDATPLLPQKYANEWGLEVEESDGAALADAEITKLETFMPVHGHPGVPAATFDALPEGAQFRATLHFTMRGPWEVRIDVSSAIAGSDHIVLPVCVTE